MGHNYNALIPFITAAYVASASSSAEAHRATPPQNYLVKKGENLESISRASGISKAEIRACNPDISIKPGTKVKLYSTYEVMDGDSLSKIAWKYRVSLADIIRYNPSIRDIAMIYPAQKIAMPCKEERRDPKPRLEKIIDDEQEETARKPRQKRPKKMVMYPSIRLPVITDPALIGQGKYFSDTRNDNIPLVAISRADLFKRISPHFLVAEFVRVENEASLGDDGKKYAHSVHGDTYFKYARIDPNIVARFEALRAEYRKPFTFDEMYRPPKYNKKEGGKPGSLHISGRAGDIRSSDPRLRKLAEKVFKRGGIGIGPTTLHVDNRAKRVRWRY